MKQPAGTIFNVGDRFNRDVLSLFSGAGGLDLGLKQSGWSILAQIEMDSDACETLRRANKEDNVPPLVLASKIESVDPKQLRQRLKMRKGDLSLIAGGPPCQPFTTSGLRQGILDGRASSLFPAYFAFIDEFQPRALVIENVDGLLSAALVHRPLKDRTPGSLPLREDEKKGSFLRWLLFELAMRNYSVSWGVVEAADYGVPQMRQRAILIGVRGSKPCFLPPPMFGRNGLPPYRTLADALKLVKELGPVQPLSKRKRAVYESIPAGGNWRNLPVEMQRTTMGNAFLAEGGKSGWWRRLAWTEPSPTILGMPDHSSTALVHPDEVRCLSVYECSACQSFPDSTSFAGTARSQYQQIGNAVPPLLGKAIGQQLNRFLAGEPLPDPEVPLWRSQSANRRIGTHGWIVPSRNGPQVSLLVKVRTDHVWSNHSNA